MPDTRARSILFWPIPTSMRAALLLAGGTVFGGLLAALGDRSAGTEPERPIAVPRASVPARPSAPPPTAQAEPLTPRMQAALDYASRRYRVSADALAPVFAAAQNAARNLGLDPLLVIAVIAVESRFNPFSESIAGAQGLMQVIPRFHKDKLPRDGGRLHLFDPAINVRVGTQALHEYIRRHGDVIGGLQQFAGDSGDPEKAYAARVLAEKERLETAGRLGIAAELPGYR
jgi:hypothetical protein